MINYNYTIRRLNEDREFSPVEKYKKLTNFSVIRGKNAIGKSTLLHLIAYSFFGYDSRSYESKYHQINKILSDKINQFNDNNEQSLLSSFEIIDESTGRKLCSEKKENDDFPVVYEVSEDGDKNYLSYEKFAQKYCVIYDIPDKPTDRISNLVDDVKLINQKLLEKIEKFSVHLEKIESDISNAKDPEKIKLIQTKIEKMETTLEPLKTNNINYSDRKKLLEILILKNDYLNIHKKVTEWQRKIEEYKLKKTLSSKEQKQREKLKDKIRVNYSSFSQYYLKAVQGSAQITAINETDQFKRLKAIQDKLSLSNWDWTSEVQSQIRDYSTFLENMYEKYRSDHKVAGIYEQLLNLLRELDRNGERLPKVKLPDLIKDVKTLVSQHQQEKNIAEGIKATSTLIDNADEHLAEFINSIEDIGEGSSVLYENPADDSQLDLAPKIKEVEREIDELDDKRQDIKQKLIHFGIDCDDINSVISQLNRMFPLLYSKYRTMDPQTLEYSLKQISLEEREQTNKIEEMEFELRLSKKQLGEIQLKDSHPLYEKRTALYNLYSKILELKSDITQYNEYFDILRKNNHSGISEKIAFYNKSISKYFAHKLGKIPYIDSHVEVLEVDYLNRQFVLVGSNNVVKFDYFSTGQAQCIYIKSLLNQNMNRKVILMLDEISSMDDETMEIIYNEIREKRAAGQLIVVILAEKSNSEPSVEEL